MIDSRTMDLDGRDEGSSVELEGDYCLDLMEGQMEGQEVPEPTELEEVMSEDINRGRDSFPPGCRHVRNNTYLCDDI